MRGTIFRQARARDAVYGYLEAVFAIVMHYKVRRRTKKLLRHAFKFAGLPFDKNADPFTAVIRCTCDDDADSKTISKWARALRYVARCKERRTRLKTFMKEAGGVNACADGYAKQCARMRSGGSRVSAQDNELYSSATAQIIQSGRLLVIASLPMDSNHRAEVHHPHQKSTPKHPAANFERHASRLLQAADFSDHALQARRAG